MKKRKMQSGPLSQTTMAAELAVMTKTMRPTSSSRSSKSGRLASLPPLRPMLVPPPPGQARGGSLSRSVKAHVRAGPLARAVAMPWQVMMTEGLAAAPRIDVLQVHPSMVPSTTVAAAGPGSSAFSPGGLRNKDSTHGVPCSTAPDPLSSYGVQNPVYQTGTCIHGIMGLDFAFRTPAPIQCACRTNRSVAPLPTTRPGSINGPGGWAMTAGHQQQAPAAGQPGTPAGSKRTLKYDSHDTAIMLTPFVVWSILVIAFYATAGEFACKVWSKCVLAGSAYSLRGETAAPSLIVPCE